MLLVCSECGKACEGEPGATHYKEDPRRSYQVPCGSMWPEGSRELSHRPKKRKRSWKERNANPSK